MFRQANEVVVIVDELPEETSETAVRFLEVLIAQEGQDDDYEVTTVAADGR